MNPRVIGANLVVSVKSFYREKSSMFFTIAFPILLILLFGTIFMNQDNMSFSLYVQDMDKSPASSALIDNLEHNGSFKVTLVGTDVNATQYAKDKKIDLILVIPKGYQKTIAERMSVPNSTANVTVRYIYDQSVSSATTKIQLLEYAFGKMNEGKNPIVKSEMTSILTKKYRYIEFFVPGIIAMSVMTSSLFGTVNMNAELKQKGVIRKLSTTPITRAEWILSNILYQLILAVISTMAILLVAYAVFQVNVQINAWLGVFIILDVFAFAGIGMILTRVAKEAESAYAAANAIMFPMMFLSGSFFQLEMMPGFLQGFAHVLPLYYVNEGLRVTMVFQDNMLALVYAAVIGAFAAVVFVVGVFTTSWKEGK
jgi:ABC-2 type transport system permease protein